MGQEIPRISIFGRIVQCSCLCASLVLRQCRVTFCSVIVNCSQTGPCWAFGDLWVHFSIGDGFVVHCCDLCESWRPEVQKGLTPQGGRVLLYPPYLLSRLRFIFPTSTLSLALMGRQ